MTGKRPIIKGSFGGHLDELVKHFPNDEPNGSRGRESEARALKEKRDIHALLFERAWSLDRDKPQGSDFSNQ